MTQRRMRATFMRGGTSKGILFRAGDLPADAQERDALFLAAMGSPDPYGRQLNGMGGGLSSLSKICVVGPTSRPDADIDYLFGQVLIAEPRVDYGGNCGNMSAAVGPFAVLSGLARAPGEGDACVVIHNVNTGKLIRSSFRMTAGEPATLGEVEIDGVSGRGAPIRLDFLDPGGSKTGRLLPALAPVTELAAGGRTVRASLVDAATPCAFVLARDFGLAGTETPEAIESRPDLLETLETLRRQAALAMGLGRDAAGATLHASVPKIAMLFGPVRHRIASGRVLEAGEMDLGVRMISMGRPHRAVPVTGAVCLGAAVRLAGTLPYRLALARQGAVRIAHPSGIAIVDAALETGPAGGPHIRHAGIVRTARRLFEGELFC